MSPAVYSMAGRLSKIDIEEAKRVVAALGPWNIEVLLQRYIKYNEAVDAMDKVFEERPDILHICPSPTDTLESLGKTYRDLNTVFTAVCEHKSWYMSPPMSGVALQPVFPKHEVNYAEQLFLDAERVLERYRTDPEIRAKELAEKNGCYLIIPATIQ